MTEQAGDVVTVYWPKPKQVGEVLDDGRPRPLAGSPTGFDLSWYALDAWAKHQASGEPCEIILVGYGKRPDGFYWYLDALNPEYLREVLGYSDRNGRLIPVCPECDQYPRHARGCSLAP